MIFVSLGTHEQPFTRALDLVAPLADEHELVVQYGHTPRRADVRATWIEFGAYDKVVGLMEEALAVVCHAGVGTIITALGAGHCPVVLPRLARFAEHVDDHQLQITRAFAERGIVVECLDGDDIRACVQRATTITATRPSHLGDLAAAVGAATLKPSPPAEAEARPSWNS